MATHFDEKGKIYTNVIAKRCVPVLIQLVSQQVHGNIHVREGERLKDELSRSDQFIAVTEASVFDLQGNILYETEFIAVHRDHVIWICPDSDRREPNKPVEAVEGEQS